MACEVEIIGKRCRISNGIWSCHADPDFADFLNEQEPENRRQFTGYSPGRDYTSAELMIDFFHDGKILKSDPPQPISNDPDVVY